MKKAIQKIIKLSWLICFVLFIACSNNEKQIKLKMIASNEKGLITVNPSDIKDTVELKLSDFIEDIEIIRLESSSQDALIKPGVVYISDNYIGYKGNHGIPGKLFERSTGKFICNLGSVGQGANEYFSITDMMICEKNESVYVLPMMAENMLVFDLKGNIKRLIPIAEKITKGAFFINDAGMIAIANMPFKNSKYVVWTQDFDGKVIHTVDSKPYIVDNYNDEMFHKGNTPKFDLFFTTQTNMWNYDIKSNKLNEVFYLDLKDKNSFFVLTELSTLFMCDILGGDISKGSFFVNKEDLRGAWYKMRNDMLGDYVMQKGLFWDGYYQWNVEPFELIEKIKPLYAQTDGDAKKRIKYVLDNINEEDNNIIILGRLKK